MHELRDPCWQFPFSVSASGWRGCAVLVNDFSGRLWGSIYVIVLSGSRGRQRGTEWERPHNSWRKHACTPSERFVRNHIRISQSRGSRAVRDTRFAQWWHHTPENRNKCEVCVSCPGLSFPEPVDHPGLPENLHSYWCSENRSHTGLPVTEVNTDCSVLLFVSRREPGKSQRNPRCEISQNQNTLLITVCGWGGGINENINMM